MDAGIITVRPFDAADLDGAAQFCDAARANDASIEPFAQRLGILAGGERALLELWRVAQGEDGALYGIAFAALREARAGAKKAIIDLYAAVHPELRRQGLGRALCEPSLTLLPQDTVLRARVRDDAKPGLAFLKALGFSEAAAHLTLSWSRKAALEEPAMPALRIRRIDAKDARGLADLARLSNEAWVGATETFATRASEIAQLFGEEGRLVLLADSGGKALAYLTGVWLGKHLGIEELAVLPDARRAGVGRALVLAALARGDASGAVLSVAETNKPARALYRSLGFAQTARRIVMELSR